MSRHNTVSPQDCAMLRAEYSFGEGFSPLLEQFNLTQDELRAHLYGDCEHDIEQEPITPPSERPVSAEACRSYRRRIADGETVPDLADDVGRDRRTIARHVTGNCSHETGGPTITYTETYERNVISAEECATLRERFPQADVDTVQEFATEYEFSYGTIANHLRGDCSHDVSVPPRETRDRAVGSVPQQMCREIRQAWRDDPETDFEELAGRFDASAATIEKHIKFQCHHDYETTFAEEMNMFATYFEDNQ